MCWRVRLYDSFRQSFMTPSDRVPYSLLCMTENFMTSEDQHRKLLSMLKDPLMQASSFIPTACYSIVFAL